MKIYNKREILILEETLNFYQAHYANEPTHKSFYVPKSQVTEAQSKSVAARIEIQTASPKPVATVIPASTEVSPLFIAAVKASNYKIRVLFPPHAEQSIVDSFRKAGVVLPSDIRPQAVGKRKPDAQAPRSWSATVIFPLSAVTDACANAPDGTHPVDGKPGLYINSQRSVVLALLQAGLVINDYAKL